MKLKFVSELIQIASLRFIEALKGSKITPNVKLLVVHVVFSFALQNYAIISFDKIVAKHILKMSISPCTL